MGLVVCFLWMSPADVVHAALRIGPEQSQTWVQGLAVLSYRRTTEGPRGCCSGLAGGGGRMERLLRPGPEESPASSLFDLGWLPSSETQQRPGGQRPCLRQVRSSSPSFLLSDGGTGGQGVARRGRPQICTLNLPFILVLFAKRQFTKWDVFLALRFPCRFINKLLR